MRNRYILVIEVPTHIQSILREAYRKATRVPLPIKNLHISILHPFFLKENKTELELQQTLHSIQLSPFTTQLGSLGMYQQKGKTILFLSLKPKQIFLELHEKIMKTVSQCIEFDKSPFTNNALPTFDPHISLDYDATLLPNTIAQLASLLRAQDLQFPIQNLILQKESENTWIVLNNYSR